MRAFIAIDLPREVKQELSKVQEQLKSENIKAKFVEPEQLHLTLKFLGEITDFQVSQIKRALEQVKFEPFKVRLNAVGIFTPQFVRVVWIDLIPKEQLIKLQQQINSELEKIGFKKEKSFKAHITLTRVKLVKDRIALAKKLKGIKVRPLEFEIKSFSLKKSTLTNKGPVYRDILTFQC